MILGVFIIKKYNLALIPISKSNEPIALAKQLSHIADKYILGQKSLPHVTLYQFQAEEKDIAQIKEKIASAFEGDLIELEFNSFSCLTFDNNIFWVSLLPNKKQLLQQMHEEIANLLQLPLKENFDPHMTLINSKNDKYEEEVIKLGVNFYPIIDNFTLALGYSDDIGQLIEVICLYQKEKRTYNLSN